VWGVCFFCSPVLRARGGGEKNKTKGGGVGGGGGGWIGPNLTVFVAELSMWS